MAVDLEATIATLEAAYTKCIQDLAALPAADFGEEGRSIQINATRESLTKQLTELENRLASLGAPVGSMGMPALTITSTEGAPRWQGPWPGTY